MKLIMKVQSISDIITNSSTEVFVVYSSSNVNTIKSVINAILSIDGNYEFDDLFTIKMIPNEYAVNDMFEDWEEFFPNNSKPATINDFWNHLDSLSQEELNNYEDIWDNKENAYYWEDYSFYDGYSVSIKEGVEKTDKLQRAVDAIRSLDSIFRIDCSCG